MIGKDLQQVKALLLDGRLVAIPTETVYGLAANAFDSEAVAKVFEAKGRPTFNPLIVHTNSLEKATDYLLEIPPLAKELAEAFWPGPLTLLLPKSEKIASLVTAGNDRVAIRVPKHSLTLKLLEELPFPLVAPSANPYQYISPTHPEHVNAQLGEKVDYILDGGRCEVGMESTIIGFDKGEPIIYRYGGLALEKIEDQIGRKIKAKENTDKVETPGQSALHYAPHNKVIVGHPVSLTGVMKNKTFAVLSFQNRVIAPNVKECRILSPEGNLQEAAANFFDYLHALDQVEVDAIIAEQVPNSGLGIAINDRLARAAAR